MKDELPETQAEESIQPWERPGCFRRDCDPHRGLLLKWLGCASLASSFTTVFLPCLGWVPGLFAIPFTVAVWRMAVRDLAEMRVGRMHPAGEEDTSLAKRMSLAGFCIRIPQAAWHANPRGEAVRGALDRVRSPAGAAAGPDSPGKPSDEVPLNHVGTLYATIIQNFGSLQPTDLPADTAPWQALASTDGGPFDMTGSDLNPSSGVKVFRVTSINDAVAALNAVAVQGEGITPEMAGHASVQFAHFKRFYDVFKAFPDGPGPVLPVPENPNTTDPPQQPIDDAAGPSWRSSSPRAVSPGARPSSGPTCSTSATACC